MSTKAAMMDSPAMRLRRCRTRPRMFVLAIIITLFIFYALLPYDSDIRSGIRFQGTLASGYLHEHFPSDKWLWKKPRYPIDFENEVGLIIKTGYGTKDRVPVLLKALETGGFKSEAIILQDFPNNTLFSEVPFSFNGQDVPTWDVVGWSRERAGLKGTKFEFSERVAKYKSLLDAINDESWETAEHIGHSIGWELDAMKFISGLDLAYSTMKPKKWYIMLDDDTLLLQPTIHMLLGHLNSKTPYYIGNPIGDFKGRFAHGGSAVIMSGAALEQLYYRHPEVVLDSYFESLNLTWGDKLLATTFMKVGVYLDETYAGIFNGEYPEITRLWAHDYCAPLASFHGLGPITLMEEAGKRFAGRKEPTFRRTLWDIFGRPAKSQFAQEATKYHANADYVGRLDEHTQTIEEVRSKEECAKACTDDKEVTCLAWAWDQDTKECKYAPFLIVGDNVQGSWSGLNANAVTRLESHCQKATPSL